MEPILRLLNLQLQRQCCSRPERFFIIEEKIPFKTHKATGGVVNFYSAGVVTQNRRIGSSFVNECLSLRKSLRLAYEVLSSVDT
jgi:hypothetical protein